MSEDIENRLRIRSLTTEQSQLSNPDGSATFSHGTTTVISSVYGPAEVRFNKELLDRAVVEVIYIPKSGLSGCQEKSLEKIIRNTCEAAILTTLYPRSCITILLQEVHNSGSLLACCLNAACMALMDSGIDMKTLFASVRCIFHKNGEIIIDPSLEEEKEARASLTFTFNNTDYNIISCYTNGVFSQEQFCQAATMCKTTSENIFIFLKEASKKKLSKCL